MPVLDTGRDRVVVYDVVFFVLNAVTKSKSENSEW